MKKHISVVFAALALVSCSKMAPENGTVISELPNGDNQQETVEPTGEGIIFQLPQTKVILNGDSYQFEGNEEIVVKARSGAVTVMKNSTDYKNTFKGVFQTSLGRESETFDFYFNCANKTTAQQELVQNGQPWLECTGVTASRVADDSEANYVVEGVMLQQLSNCITLALVSPYACTVDFHSLSAAIPATQDNTILGMSITAGKPYFVNINTDTNGEFNGGFYLAVNKTGETGTMYTSYATATPISKNTPIQIKTDFTPLSITGSLSGFNTSYSIYTDENNSNRVADANNVSNDYMSGGSLTLHIAGISNSLLPLISLDNITISSSDGKTLGSTNFQPTWENKTYTWSFGDASSHTTWGELTVTATAVFNTPAGEVTAEVPALSRHITGLPNTLAPSKDYWSNSRGSASTHYENGYIRMYGANNTVNPLIKSINFHIPSDPNFNGIDVLMISKYYIQSYVNLAKRYTTITAFIGGSQGHSYTRTSNGGEEVTNAQGTGNLNSAKPYVEYEVKGNTVAWPDYYCDLKTTELKYN